jgi:hypothetical protein
MEVGLLLLIILGVLYAFWAMMRFTFRLIDRAHERLREEARNAGSPLAEGKDA